MRAILLLVLFFFWVSCSNSDDPDTTLDEESSSSIESSESYSSSESSSSEESRSSSSDSEISEKMSENAHPDFIKIIATDKVVEVRDNGTENQNEFSLKVKLSYDYLIGKHEVTCGEYKSITDTSLTCENDSLPITNVSYIDAILYANAKSKAEGFDTAYSYTSKGCNSYNCTQIEGLQFKPQVNAYRLPTEAEWMFAAQQGWDPSKSWTAENAGSTTHTVCSNGQNDLGICDLEGNVTEWVNDWLAKVSDTIVVNFIGSNDGGKLGERVIKGGNIHSEAGSTSFYTRRDIYTVTSSTTSDYLGFRLAFGEIPDALWMSSKGFSSKTAITLTSNAGSVRSKTLTFKTKLAFRNDESGNLVYIDYSSEDPSPIEIIDTLNVFHPEISPNGEHVAFCTNVEGIDGKSEIFVRDLNTEGTNLVKLPVENAAIPRWKVLNEKDTVLIYVSSAQSNKNTSLFMTQSTWMVPFANGQFGSPQKLLDGAYHGGIDDNLTFAVSGSTLLRAHTANSTDTIWYNSEQACNVSLSKDGSNRTLFLDFGGKTGRKFAGRNYRTHEQLLIANGNGTLIQSIPAPSGYSFDHTEWVDSNLVVATLTSANGHHEKIILLDISDSSVTELAHGDELWHPAMWINDTRIKQVKLDLDSAGIYWQQASDPLLASKMNAFWVLSDSIEVIALGSSRVSQGFAPELITHGRTFNMATVPSDMDVSFHQLYHYIFPHCPKLKAIVISLDLDLWYEQHNINFSKNILMLPGFFYDINHNFWIDQDVSELKQISAQILSEQEPLQEVFNNSGFVKQEIKNSWSYGLVPIFLANDSTWSLSDETYKYALLELETIIRIAQEKDILVVGVVYPQSPDYRNTGSFGRHGMMRSTAIEILEQIAQFDSTYSNFIFMDENQMGYHDYADSLAFDHDHMNYWGARVITSRIDSAITAATTLKEP